MKSKDKKILNFKSEQHRNWLEDGMYSSMVNQNPNQNIPHLKGREELLLACTLKHLRVVHTFWKSRTPMQQSKSKEQDDKMRKVTPH